MKKSDNVKIIKKHLRYHGIYGTGSDGKIYKYINEDTWILNEK